MQTLYTAMHNITASTYTDVLKDELYSVIEKYVGQAYVQCEQNDVSALTFVDGKVTLHSFDDVEAYTKQQVIDGNIGNSGGYDMYADSLECVFAYMLYKLWDAFDDVYYDGMADDSVTLLALMKGHINEVVASDAEYEQAIAIWKRVTV
jgi:hypothetical protein